MSNKRSKKNTTKNDKNNRKTSKNRKIPTIRLENNAEILAKTTYIKDTKCFKINDIDIDKIRVSDKKLYNKEHNSYKYYVFYEHGDKYILLKFILRDVVGYYNDYKDNKKTMNFKVDDDSLDKIIDIFEYLEEKLKIDLNNLHMKVRAKNILKQKYLMKDALEKTKIKKLMQFQTKILSIIVEYYYKYNLFTIVWKIKI